MDNASEARLRQQLEMLQKQRLQQARKFATVFGVMSILALLAVVYGFVQHVDANSVKEAAAKESQEALVMKEEAQRQVAEAKQAMLKLEELAIELEICRASIKK